MQWLRDVRGWIREVKPSVSSSPSVLLLQTKPLCPQKPCWLWVLTLELRRQRERQIRQLGTKRRSATTSFLHSIQCSIVGLVHNFL
ncbi:hypothetical protein LSAT2_002526 [Lamellibrachia satsuma]|nr:hypothetical protein LSAT2_002526 [Lamellibrachia satsuma]